MAIITGLVAAGLLWLISIAVVRMNDTNTDQWWLATLGRTVVWARLRVREAGTAEVLDSDGNTLAYDSEDTARAALMDAEFVALDGLDDGRRAGARFRAG